MWSSNERERAKQTEAQAGGVTDGVPFWASLSGSPDEVGRGQSDGSVGLWVVELLVLALALRLSNGTGRQVEGEASTASDRSGLDEDEWIRASDHEEDRE